MTLAWLIAALLVLLAVAAAVATRVPALERTVRAGAVAAEAVVVLFVVADLGLMLRSGERPESMLTHAGYALASVGLLPLLLWRPAPQAEGGLEAEPEPVSLWVVAVALVAVAVCAVRLVQTR